MENKILFLTMETIHSNKKNQDYYIIRYLLDKKHQEDFVSKEVYDKISLKNLQYLKEYTGIFTLGSNKHLVLFDIK